jgi:hypothetical protein
MASAPQPQLPLFYNDLTPLNSRDHAKYRARTLDRAPWAVGQHAIPLTVDEFPLAHRHFPIVFSVGENPVPLALFGLNEGVSVFFDDKGTAMEDFYIPAYIRRYPFMLARLDPNSETMSLCFDPSSGLVEEGDEGNPLFDGDQPSSTTMELMDFCQKFEEAGLRTQQFMDEIKSAGLLMDGEVAIARPEEPDKPYVYRGFQMINQEKLVEVRGDKLRTWNQNGLLPLIYAHMFSLDIMRIVFGKQVQQGKLPAPSPGVLQAEPTA